MAPALRGYRDLEMQVAAERGGFTLFALFMREEVPDRWDLIVSAPWIGGDSRGAVDYFVSVIKSRLGDDHLIRLSRIVVADPDAPGIQALNAEVEVEHGAVEIREYEFFGVSSSSRTSSPPSAFRLRRRRRAGAGGQDGGSSALKEHRCALQR
ncbi:MAG TPA: hypothetical protein VFV05_24890 [Methylomirabilota bacterium]|nr:hypothetical protein [Methylomirabilota bacterium]